MDLQSNLSIRKGSKTGQKLKENVIILACNKKIELIGTNSSFYCFCFTVFM